MQIDFREHPSPGSVESSITELKRWRKNRIKKGLECGTIDRAALFLEKYRNTLIDVYKAAMAAEDASNLDMTTRTRILVEDPDPTAELEILVPDADIPYNQDDRDLTAEKEIPLDALQQAMGDKE